MFFLGFGHPPDYAKGNGGPLFARAGHPNGNRSIEDLPMSCHRRSNVVGLVLFSATVMLTAGSVAAERRAKSRPASQPKAEEVELFAAIEEGQVDVQFIPRDSREARVLIKNKTKKPLNVRLPEAFAAAPVLAQPPPGLGGGQRGGAGVAGGAQPMGGGMGGMGMGGMGMGGMGMGMMNVPPEKIAKLKVPCVCLEHGKPEPRPAIPYEIKPFASYSDDPKLYELMKLFGRNGVSQRAAQAAAWHVSSGMSWNELAAKEIEHIAAPNEPYFSQLELAVAMKLVDIASRAALDHERHSPVASQSTSPAANATEMP
ncbi:MAG: hypothetical protein AB7O68_13790 [Pirellulales bacterium]